MSHKHILLTGPPGVGKTTIIKKTCGFLKDKNIKIKGFYTEEVRSGKERIGFDIVDISGQRGVLARISENSSKHLPRVGKYSVHVSSVETLALPLLDCDASSVLVLDEIGKMEMCSRAFAQKLPSVFTKKDIKVLATIPVARRVLPFVDELRNRDDCLLIQITRENRNNVPNEIVEYLMKA